MTVDKVSPHHMGSTAQIRERAPVERVLPHAEGAAPETGHIQEGVDISDRAKELARLKLLVAQMPDPPSGRVEEIKHRVASGTYEVPAIEVARKMLET